MTQPTSRAEQKERTRRAILDTALRLSGDTPLAALSLRQVAKASGLAPASFYRHFDSTDALGLALVEESFASLHGMLREVRRRATAPDDLIDTSVAALVGYAEEHLDHFRLIARERYAGPWAVRQAIRQQMLLFQHELAIDLARVTGDRWSTDDLHELSRLVVNTIAATLGELVGDEADADEARERAGKQLRIIFVGALAWRSATS